MVQRICLSVAVSLFGLCSVARAEQFVLADVTYTHSTDTTKDSHYYVTLPADTPKDWTKPIDYSTGSVHLVVDVKTKPAGDAPTKFQVCLEGTPSYACTLQSPTYTKVGKVVWDSPFKDFWYDSTVDWSKGIKKMPIILKDDNNNKPAGDPKYMPSDVHVQVTLVAPGSKFVEPPAAGSGGAGSAAAGAGAGGAGGAAAGGAGGADAGAGAGGAAGARAGAGGTVAAGGSAAAASGGTSASGASGASSSPVAGKAASAGRSGAAGSVAGAASPTPSATAGSVGTMTSAQAAGDGDSADSGCRAAGSGASGAWTFGLVLASLASLRRRKPRPAGI